MNTTFVLITEYVINRKYLQRSNIGRTIKTFMPSTGRASWCMGEAVSLHTGKGGVWPSLGSVTTVTASRQAVIGIVCAEEFWVSAEFITSILFFHFKEYSFNSVCICNLCILSSLHCVLFHFTVCYFTSKRNISLLRIFHLNAYFSLRIVSTSLRIFSLQFVGETWA